jgi:hypothetical protein
VTTKHDQLQHLCEISRGPVSSEEVFRHRNLVQAYQGRVQSPRIILRHCYRCIWQAASTDPFWHNSLNSVVKDYFMAHNCEFKHVPVLSATIKAYSYAKQFQKAYQLWKSHAEKLPRPLDSQLLAVAIDAARFGQDRDWINVGYAKW